MPFDAFLKIQGIEGESTDKVHPGEIVLTSFSWGESNSGSAGSGGGGGAGKTSLQDFHFTMASSKASPSLLLTCAIGRTIQSAILTCRSRGGGGFEFMKVTMTDCLVSSFQIGAHLTDTAYSLLGGDEAVPIDQVTLNFSKVDFLWTVQRTGEQVEVSFDNSGAT